MDTTVPAREEKEGERNGEGGRRREGGREGDKEGMLGRGRKTHST